MMGQLRVFGDSMPPSPKATMFSLLDGHHPATSQEALTVQLVATLLDVLGTAMVSCLHTEGVADIR